jgi:hypothetical protein
VGYLYGIGLNGGCGFIAIRQMGSITEINQVLKREKP